MGKGLSLDGLRDGRRALHRRPEISGAEVETADEIVARLETLGPAAIHTGLGGHGVAATFEGASPGPTVLVRCELDALPIQETGAVTHRSAVSGVAHLCGHDGHMAIVLGLAARLAAKPPRSGRVVLLFQPAEETGEGARAVVGDPRFDELRPDWAFALHNLPGEPLGAVVLRDGTFNCASRGLIVKLVGETSHAAEPEAGRSPAQAMCALVAALGSLHERASFKGGVYVLSTVVHARLGEVAFGTSPGEAVVMATLRAETDSAMDALAVLASAVAIETARAHGLGHALEWRDVFDASVNDEDAAGRVRSAARALGVAVIERDRAFRWSEDFGALGATAKSAMFGLGAGEAHAPLHASDYDFPDELIARGVELFERVVRDLLD